MKAKDIRALFLEYFESKGHQVYASMPLVPDDASLLFTNAGMVQFKDIFTGKIPIPSQKRATSAQLCIRAGGKHNDLENVGYTARHHTLFEMLGNFSFGDYFKKEAIAYAWEFVTEILGFDKSLLYVTIHESDDEAYELWCRHIDSSRIKRMGDKDNFWQMGDTGPCGPCSEIFVDQGEKHFKGEEDYFGGDGDRFLEIWNLVFMQYERDKDGKLKPLPKPSIDTGMGLERVVALLEGKFSNFDSSLFMPLIKKVEALSGQTYVYESGASFRVIADHSRSVTFLLAQGVHFDKEGRGYVLRRILRRAVRHGYLLGLRKAFLYEIVGAVCVQMGEHYGYLRERQNAIMEQCKAEEERFFETIELGMSLFNAELDSIKKHKEKNFKGHIAFKLYDTYGFPLDLTQDMLREVGLSVDMEGFEKCMQEQKDRSKAHWKGSGDSVKEGDFNTLLNEFGENTFNGYTHTQTKSRILALLDSNFKRIESLQSDAYGYVMLDSTPFYPESGGPVGDKGILKIDSNIVAKVLDTQKFFGLNLSKITTANVIKTGDLVDAQVDSSRLEIAKHHSATHLLHYALRKILGSHITQAGSLVESNRLRFDFSHPKALTNDELEAIEELVNAQILSQSAQICENMGITEAKEKGAMALFGEKYGESVRVITFGDSIELCGGIHVQNTAEIGSFYIVRESSVSSGTRRIEAVCGKAAYQYGKNALDSIKILKNTLKTQDVMQGIMKLKEQIQTLKEKVGKGGESAKTLESEILNEVKLIVLNLKNIDTKEAKELVDNAKNENQKVAILLITQNENKVTITAGVKNAPLKAGVWVKQVAQELGGNGGGRDDFATAGGKDISKIKEALDLAKQIARESLK
ncbi:alanine--tRNA ligase [Helicobacter turcicus]|uniref:Alanine--tRNA ligase n=1 Tax=Helicobacter turcicus TaxID=2867412 RepID=A0ABS7JL45_9HELI|nr:alanine--tRNA ligase [Helicobacter turcicus]MBX7490091.1 alanine--tRNA ligase [Helicobacter turcicus]MBX7544950.1 alanine--tRNA ligase [Helicobacter turcicus]